MEITISPPKSTQVANILEKEIIGMKLDNGQRLQTFRSLAERFSVSRQVIVSAFDILEKKQVILRRGKRGAIVNSKLFNNGLKRIFILLHGIDRVHTYEKRILAMRDYSLKGRDYLFTLKLIPDAFANQSVFDHELSHLMNASDIDCLLVGAGNISKREITKLKKLGFPMIFLGDFFNATLNELPVNRITSDNSNIADSLMTFCLQKKYANIAVFSGLSSIYFYGVVNEKIRDVCRHHNINLSFHERKGGNDFASEEELLLFYRNAIAELRAGPLPEILILNGIGKGELVLRELKRAGISVPEDLHVVSTDSESYHCGISCLQSEWAPFYDAAFERIEQVCNGDQLPEQTSVEIDYRILELSSTV